MVVQINIINIFCVPLLTSIKSYLVFSSTETYQFDILSYCLSITQPNIATSLIEKEPMNTQVSLFLDNLEFQWSF